MSRSPPCPSLAKLRHVGGSHFTHLPLIARSLGLLVWRFGLGKVRLQVWEIVSQTRGCHKTEGMGFSVWGNCRGVWGLRPEGAEAVGSEPRTAHCSHEGLTSPRTSPFAILLGAMSNLEALSWGFLSCHGATQLVLPKAPNAGWREGRLCSCLPSVEHYECRKQAQVHYCHSSYLLLLYINMPKVSEMLL